MGRRRMGSGGSAPSALSAVDRPWRGWVQVGGRAPKKQLRENGTVAASEPARAGAGASGGIRDDLEPKSNESRAETMKPAATSIAHPANVAYVEELFERWTGRLGGDALAECRQLREPRAAVAGRLGLWETG